MLAIEGLDRLGSRIYNLGCGGGFSVTQVVEAAREVTGHPIPVSWEARRPGDPAVLVASSDRIQTELGWRPERGDLQAILGDAWSWLRGHPFGYAA